MIRALSTIARASLKLRKYVFTKTLKVAVTAGEFHARKTPKQQYPKAVTFSDLSFSKKCIKDHAVYR